MAHQIAEINRFRCFRLFSVTEIILSPFRGRIFSAVIFGGATFMVLDVIREPNEVKNEIEKEGASRFG